MLPKGPYNPNETEKEILSYWLDNKFYSPEYQSEDELATSHSSNSDRETYTNILPPPNANGNLHLGHMSGYAYQDLMGRYKRMKGKKVLLLPGKDHAGIQTEVVFERKLEEKGKSKQELGREEFYKQCYDFCIENGRIATEQEQKLGLSADFDRELFTLDPKIVDEVLQTFVDMYEDKLIYRDKRLINWCVRCQSALADIDTEYKDSVGKFYYFKYGFLEPEEYAVEIKNKYAGKTIEATVERFKGMEYTSKEGTTYEWGFDYYGRLDGEINPADDMDLDVIFVGYPEGTIPEEKLSGKAIGIMMRLDQDYKLIIANEKATEEQIQKELDWLFFDFSKYFAGLHIIKFDEYPEDRFYTNGFILATVRPETKFGDTAIVANPKDERYAEWIGKEVEVNTLNGPATLKVIADRAIEAEFGTGIMKLTPAHAPDDWDIAQRHPETMPEKQVIGFDGKLNHLTGKYEGMKVNEAREAMIPDMKEKGILVHLNENYKNRRQICERCKHPIEPLISHQWFLDTKPLKEKAKQLVKDGFTKIMPEGKENVYLNWMDAPEDWCITRQLWWGYRVPVWYKTQPEEYVTETGEVKEKIGDKIVHGMEDYKDLIHVGQLRPGKQITFVRHGQSDANVRGIFSDKNEEHKLTDLGIDQAFQLGETLKNKGYELIITSSMARAKQTAEEINKSLNLEIVESDLIIERDFGILGGQKVDEAVKKYNGVNFQSLEGFEDNDSIRKRVKDFFEWIGKEHSGKKILVVSHGNVIKTMAGKYDSSVLQNKSESSKLKIKNCDPIEFVYEKSSDNWVQDEDVLDTWFSSGQWPMVTLLANNQDKQEFYPTQVMETGWDILIFWVTRMMLLCPYKNLRSNGKTIKDLESADGKAITPFKDVYLHGLVLDKKGVKMSKSKGNGIDPFEMMQKYGTDALRLSFVVGNKVGQNYRLYEEKIQNFRNYCNKIWNISKFTMFNFGEDFDPGSMDESTLPFAKEDKEMKKHIDDLVKDTTNRMDSFNFGVAATELYESVWHKFADEYLEEVKPRIYTKDREGNAINTSPEEQASRNAALYTLWYALDKYLRLLHPFIPFITERIWREMPKIKGESETLMYARFPQ